MKKLVSFVIVLVLFVSIVPLQSLAVNCQYSTTQSFLDYLDMKNVRYTWQGLDSDDDEKIEVTYTGDNMETIRTVWYFDNNPVRVGVRVWNIINFSVKDYYYVLEAVNNVNADYRYIKFYVDTTDNTVTAKFDMPISATNAGELCYDILQRTINIVDDVYAELSEYDMAS